MIVCYTDGGYNNIKKENGYGSFKVYLDDTNIVINRFTFNNVTSSNEAEYETFTQLLQWLLLNCNTDDEIVIYSDSKLLVNQINHNWQVKSDTLILYYQTAQMFFSKFPFISVEWKPRKDIIRELGH